MARFIWFFVSYLDSFSNDISRVWVLKRDLNLNIDCHSLHQNRTKSHLQVVSFLLPLSPPAALAPVLREVCAGVLEGAGPGPRTRGRGSRPRGHRHRSPLNNFPLKQKNSL